MSHKPYVLHVPDMWKSQWTALGRHQPFKTQVRKRDIQVEQTGITDKSLKDIPEDQKSELHVMILPIAHCSLNIEDFGLEILGPCVSTRNDIFVFKRAEKLPIHKDRGRKYFVGVKELDITTTNILRIALSNWPADAFLGLDDSEIYRKYPTAKGSIEEIRDLLALRMFRCIADADPSERLKKLKSGAFDAAVFMGNELGKAQSSLFFDSSLIDVLNLNRVMNRRYHTVHLPRAIFCIRKISSPWTIDKKKEFCSIYNEALNYIGQRRDKSLGQWSFQRLTSTGPYSVKKDIETLIRFSKDMNDERVKAWRYSDVRHEDEGEVEKSRPIKPTDFSFWPQFYDEKLKNEYLAQLELKFSEIGRLLGPSARLYDDLSSCLNDAKSKLIEFFSPDKFIDYSGVIDDKLIEVVSQDSQIDFNSLRGIERAVRGAIDNDFNEIEG